MDAVLKETQRIKPTISSIRRRATADIKLENDITIHKGDRIMVDTANMWNADHYDKPEKFDPRRFLRWLEEGKENIAHLVKTSSSIWALGTASTPALGGFSLPTSSRSRSAT